MDDHSFLRIDREMERRMTKEADEAGKNGYEWQYDRWIEESSPDCNNRWENELLKEGDDSIFDWNPRIEMIDTPPEPFVLIPIGEWDGEDLLPGTIILDDSYIVYLEIENPEC